MNGNKRSYAEMAHGSSGRDDADALEDGEEIEESASIRPPPPPPVLRLVVHHSSANPAADLLPAHQTVAAITETTSIGRDRSYDARIRLKSLEVSKTHATLYYNEIDAHWCILDNASTHGTFVRPDGEQAYARLSVKGATSLPRVLRHLDTLKIANQRFIVHLHAGIGCDACSELEDGSNVVPLLAMQPAKSSAGPAEQTALPQKTRTKDEKWKDYKTDMKSLRANLLARPVASGSGTSGRARDISPRAGLDVNADTRIIQYIDRAKLRRTTYGASVPLSDAQPPRLPMPEAMAAARVEPSYGPGQSLFAKMTGSVSGGETDAAKGRRMGSVIEVKTTDRRGAGLGSGAMRTGVEQVANAQTDWRSAARDRRWQDVQGRP